MTKFKPLLALAFPVLTLLSSFSEPICPEPLCWDEEAEWCAFCETGGGERVSQSTALVNPPNSSITFNVEGSQCTNLKVQNLNVLGVTVRSEVTPPVYDPWSVVLLPGLSSNKDYCRFRTLPVPWGWDISTISDAANVAITASWKSW
jgi:hypothetical protein